MISADQPRAADQGNLIETLRKLIGSEGVVKPSILVQKLDGRWEQAETPTELPLLEGKAPAEFPIFRAGVNTSIKGDFVFDDEAAKSVMTLWAERKLDLMMDYEHMSLVKPPVVAPASCKRFVPEVRNGELWATQCQWTDRARAMLEAGEYRYFSPAFHFDPETRRIYYLINVALTNNPALDAIRPLVAASAVAATETATATTKEPPVMKINCTGCKASLKAASDDGDGDEAYCSACLSSAKMSALGHKMLRTLSLSTDMGETAILSGVEGIAGFRTELLSLTGQSTLAAARGVVEGWKTKATEADGLRTRLGELEQAKLAADFEAAIADKVGKKHISPAQAQDIQAKAKKDGRYDKDRVEFATGLLSAFTAPLVSTVEVKASESSIALDPQEMAMCKQMGKDPEEYAKWKAGYLRGAQG